MAVELDQAERAVFGQCPQHWQRGQVVSARRQRDDALICQIGVKRRNAVQSVGNIHRIGRNIPQIRAIHQGEGADACDGVHAAYHG